MAKWLAKEFDWDTGRYTGNYYDIAEAGIVAVFVDSFYGDDTAAGTAAAPFKTLSKAITTLNSTGANGSRIFMNGIFLESLATQTYSYEFIGCGGGRNGRTIWLGTLVTRTIITKTYSRYQNLELLGYENQSFIDSFPAISYNIPLLYMNNVFLKNVDFYTTGSYFSILFMNSFLINSTLNGSSQSRSWRFLGTKNIFYNLSGDGIILETTLTNSHFEECDSLTIYGTGANNNFIEKAQFISPDNYDFNVRITSPLIGAGTVDEITGIAANLGGVELGLPYNGITPEFTTGGGATITDLTIDSTGRFTITAPSTSGTLETGLMDLGNIYPLENIDLFNILDFASGEITQGVFETFSSPRMALTIKLKYGLTSAEVGDCPWLLIEYGKQPTFSGTGAGRVGNADDTFDPDTFQTITCRYMKLFVTLQNNS